MACGVALKRPLDLDPYMSPEGSSIKRPRTSSHCSPFRPTFGTVAASLPGSSSTSPFGQFSSKLSSEQLESYLRAEIRYLRRRRLIPRRQERSGRPEQQSYRAPSSPHHSSDSEGEQPASSGSNCAKEEVERPQFSLTQVQLICERLLKEQENRLRTEYENVLSTKLSEQYDTFVKFTQDQIRRQMSSNDECSYVS